MSPLVLGPVLDLGKSLIDRLFPDKEKAAEAEREFLKMAMQGDLAQTIAQLEVNAKEAAHPSVFVSGWRPFFGWSSGMGFVYSVMLHPVLNWVASIKGLPPLPELNIDLLWIVATGMLGIGGMRSFEKVKGVAAK